MRRNSFLRSIIGTMLVGGLAACEHAPTTPVSADSLASDDRGAAATGRGGTTVTPADSARICKQDELPNLTARQIAQIRALYQAFNDAVAEDLRFIAAVEKAAREAKEAEATAEQVAAILARADEAKRHVAALERRLRAAIADILTPDQRERHCTPVLAP